MKKMTPLFASRLAMLREAKTNPKISQSDLARAIGVTPQAVQKWEAGASAPRRTKLKVIGQTLSTTVAELISGTELEELPSPHTTKYSSESKVFPLRQGKAVRPTAQSGGLPLITWIQAAVWGEIMETIEREEAQDWLVCPYNHGPHAFILEISGESNFDPAGSKSYSPGDLIYVDPSREPANRSMVVVRIDHEDRAQLKQLLMDERGTRMLKALNPNWPERVIPMPDNSSIVGVVLGKWVPE